GTILRSMPSILSSREPWFQRGTVEVVNRQIHTRQVPVRGPHPYDGHPRGTRRHYAGFGILKYQALPRIGIQQELDISRLGIRREADGRVSMPLQKLAHARYQRLVYPGPDRLPVKLFL